MPRFAPCTCGCGPPRTRSAPSNAAGTCGGCSFQSATVDGPEHDIPALARRTRAGTQPAGRHHGVGVGGGQPDRGRIQPAVQPEQFGHPGRPRRADAAAPDADDPGAAAAGHRRGLIRAGVGHHQHMHGDGDLAGGPPQRRQAGRQQRFLVVRRHARTADRRRRSHQARRLGHRYGRPVGADVDLGQEVRLGVADQAGQPGRAASMRCTSSPDRDSRPPDAASARRAGCRPAAGPGCPGPGPARGPGPRSSTSISENTMRSKQPAGHSRGSSRRVDADMRHIPGALRARPGPRPPRCRRPAGGRSAGRASWSARPTEQPGSKARRYRRAGSCARLTAYLRRSYQRCWNPHGSRGGRVHRVEVAQRAEELPERSPQQHLLRPGEMRHDPGRQHGPARGPAVGAAGWRRPGWPNASWPRRGGQRYPARTRPGHPRVSRAWPSATSRSGSSARSGRPPRPPGAPRGPRPRDRRARPDPTAPGRRRNRRTARAGGGELVLAGGHPGVGEPQPDHFGVLGAQHGRARRPTPRSASAPIAAGSASGMRRLAVGDRDQAQPRSGRGQDGHRPADAEHLVVGMGRDDQRRSPRPAGRPPAAAAAPATSPTPPPGCRAGRCGSAQPAPRLTTWCRRWPRARRAGPGRARRDAGAGTRSGPRPGGQCASSWHSGPAPAPGRPAA